MNEFYVDVNIKQGETRVQVEEISDWGELELFSIPKFKIDYYNGNGFTTLTLQLENGKWYDRNTRYSEEEYYLRYFDLGPDAWNADYKSPLTDGEIQEVGRSIARHMVVMLTARVGLFVPVFPNPRTN